MASSEIVVVGLSHKTAPVALREKLAVPAEDVARDLRALVDGAGGIEETVVLSTCNRVEVYAAAGSAQAAVRAARDHLRNRAHPDEIDGVLYERAGEDAVRHAFRVAASLDSMVLGEPQILGQVKDAYELATSTGTTGTLLSRVFQTAFAVAKRVRTETGIAAGTVSVSSIACELAERVFGDLAGRRVLLVGAGKMSEASAKHLRTAGARLVVLNRSRERAEELAREYGGEARTMEQLASELALADVVICSTAAPRFVVTRDVMASVVKSRRHRLMLIVDIAVPRDVDPRVGEMENVFLYDVDHLQSVAQENLARRAKEADRAEQLVLTEVRTFETWRKGLSITPTIVALRAHFRGVVLAELERTAPRLKGLSEEDRKSLERMADAMVSKLLHRPLAELKKGGADAEGARLAAAVHKLFDLDPAPDVPEGAPAEAEPAEGDVPASRPPRSEPAR